MKKTFAQYIIEIEQELRAYPKSRRGKTALSVLLKYRPNLAEKLGTNVNPYYDDRRLARFYSYVAEHWDDDDANLGVNPNDRT